MCNYEDPFISRAARWKLKSAFPANSGGGEAANTTADYDCHSLVEATRKFLFPGMRVGAHSDRERRKKSFVLAIGSRGG